MRDTPYQNNGQWGLKQETNGYDSEINRKWDTLWKPRNKIFCLWKGLNLYTTNYGFRVSSLKTDYSDSYDIMSNHCFNYKKISIMETATNTLKHYQHGGFTNLRDGNNISSINCIYFCTTKLIFAIYIKVFLSEKLKLTWRVCKIRVLC